MQANYSGKRKKISAGHTAGWFSTNFVDSYFHISIWNENLGIIAKLVDGKSKAPA